MKRQPKAVDSPKAIPDPSPSLRRTPNVSLGNLDTGRVMHTLALDNRRRGRVKVEFLIKTRSIEEYADIHKAGYYQEQKAILSIKIEYEPLSHENQNPVLLLAVLRYVDPTRRKRAIEIMVRHKMNNIFITVRRVAFLLTLSNRNSYTVFNNDINNISYYL